MKAYLGALALCLLTIGCAGRNTLPKTFPSDVKNWNGTLDRVEFLQDFNVTDYARVRVDGVSTSRAALPDSDSNTYGPVTSVLGKASDHFTSGVKDGLSSIPIDEAHNSAGKTLVIHATVTTIDPGSAALRFWVNFGAGSVHVSVSGDVTDSSTNRVLLRFESTSSDAAMSSLGIEGYEGLMAGAIRRTGHNVGTLINAFTPVK